MRTHRWLFPIGLWALAGAAGCGGGETGTGSGPAPKPAAIIGFAVDANRDGVADLSDVEDTKDKLSFDDKHGASFLANLDDDDGDHIRDADDDRINGDADLEDLARIMLAPWPDAPDGAVGKFTVDAASLDAVRVWAKGLDSNWYLVAGSVGPCVDQAPCQLTPEATFGTAEVRAGLELGIEGRRFRAAPDDPWTGEVDLGYRILEKDAPDGKVFTTEALPDGIDKAKMRVAPWVLFGNLSPFDVVWADNSSTAFANGIDAATKKAGITFNRIKNWNDQWTQDYFQTAWTAIPGKDGAVHGMRIANARPWGRNDGQDSSLPIVWLTKNYLGSDRGVIEIYKKKWSGSSFDSHGNHDLLPPYEFNGTKWPLGRIITGSGILPETGQFYDAQQVQGPHLVVVTDWLYVGHVDEIFSYVPAKTPRGWKLLVASPRLAKQMLEKAVTDGNGSVNMFVGKQKYKGETDVLISAEISIDATLADPDLMQWAQEAQTEIDADVQIMKDEVGLTDEEIIEIPILFEDLAGYKVAWNPGTANLLAFGDYTVHPDPFGPQIGGVDIFKQDLIDRLGTPVNALASDGMGLDVNFADDWYDYHILDGEVHCGSNPEAPAPFASVKWWETGR